MPDEVKRFEAKGLTVVRNVRKDGPAVLINIIDGGESRRGSFAQARTFLDELEREMKTRGRDGT